MDQEMDCPPARAARAKEHAAKLEGGRMSRIESLSGAPPAVYDRGSGRRHSPLGQDHCQSRRNSHPRAMLMQEQPPGLPMGPRTTDDCITDIGLSIIDNKDQKHIFRLLQVLHITFQFRSLNSPFHCLLFAFAFSYAVPGSELFEGRAATISNIIRRSH